MLRHEKSQSSESLAGQGFCQIFTFGLISGAEGQEAETHVETRLSSAELTSRKRAGTDCTKLRQLPVDELHSTENREDRVAIILLTSAGKSVKTHSFFDKFPKLSRVGCRQNLRASVGDTGLSGG